MTKKDTHGSIEKSANGKTAMTEIKQILRMPNPELITPSKIGIKNGRSGKNGSEETTIHGKIGTKSPQSQQNGDPPEGQAAKESNTPKVTGGPIKKETRQPREQKNCTLQKSRHPQVKKGAGGKEAPSNPTTKVHGAPNITSIRIKRRMANPEIKIGHIKVTSGILPGKAHWTTQVEQIWNTRQFRDTKKSDQDPTQEVLTPQKGGKSGPKNIDGPPRQKI